nr:type VI secretion system ATPase TssH [Gammaproteobacteria bacterium]
GLTDALHEDLLNSFKPAFLGRVALVPYYPLSDDVMVKIINLKLGKVGRRVTENYGATFTYSDDVVENIAARCQEVESGARNVDHILTKTLLPEMSEEFLTRAADGDAIEKVHVSYDTESGFVYEIG